MRNMSRIQFYNVKSFGKFPLNGCFDEAYVSAIMALGINPAFYLLNDRSHVGVNEKGCFFSHDIRRELKDFELLLGIESQEYKVEKGDIARESIEKLKNGYLLIVRIRGISGINIETGKKTQRSSSEHWILVFGYDPEKEKFIALEHNNNISAKYSPCEIDADEYRKAYKLAQKKEEDPSNDIYLIKRRDGFREVPVDGELFREFLDDYNANMKHDELGVELFIENASITQAFVSVLNEVIKKYQKEQWLHDQINRRYEFLDLLLRELFLIRTYCVKCQFLGLTEPNEKLRDHMNKAIAYSKKYYEEKKRDGAVA